MATKPKTLSEISKVIGSKFSATSKGLGDWIKDVDKKGFDEAVKNIEKIYKLESDRLEIYEKLKDAAHKFSNEENETVKLIDKQYAATKKVAGNYKDTTKYLDAVKTSLNYIIKQNEDLYNISHKMQLEGNVSWSNYRKLYDAAYEAARGINVELGKQLYTAKEIANTQNTLIQDGWKGLSASNLTNISAQVALMQRTLGAFPVELSTAFKLSYRQFGDTTDRFINSVGNTLNAFSGTFGTSIGMLTGAVSNMMASNSFIFRNNMQAQITANESLIKAAALSGQIGLTSTNFLTSLANVTQFGTMSQMSTLYQAGALLNNFSVEKFQEDMISGDYSTATEGLFQSIYDTLNGVTDHYLRAEYMNQIGSAFGLSNDELLEIATNGGNLSAYSQALQEKLADSSTSMVDELKDFHMTVADQLENWWGNTEFSETIGRIFSETGLYGIGKYLTIIIGLMGTNKLLSGAGGISGVLGKLLGSGSKAATSSASGLLNTGILGASLTGGKLLGAGAVTALGVGANILGRNEIINPDVSSGQAATSAALNVLTGIGSGAVTGGLMGGGPAGAIIGGILGGVGGVANTITAYSERKNALQEVADEQKLANRAALESKGVYTGDNVVEAIKSLESTVQNVVNSNFGQYKQMQLVLETYKKTTTVK